MSPLYDPRKGKIKPGPGDYNIRKEPAFHPIAFKTSPRFPIVKERSPGPHAYHVRKTFVNKKID